MITAVCCLENIVLQYCAFSTVGTATSAQQPYFTCCLPGKGSMAQLKPLVLCVGDSQTDGTAGQSTACVYLLQHCLGLVLSSALAVATNTSHCLCFWCCCCWELAGSSFVKRLAKYNPQLQFKACGVNGMPSESMAKRLPQLLRRYPNPAAVLFMAGSNDCIAQERRSLNWFYRIAFQISRPATQDAFVENMACMVETVKRTCPKAKVGHCMHQSLLFECQTLEGNVQIKFLQPQRNLTYL
jgi:lysophospholipase L1-like esterase